MKHEIIGFLFNFYERKVDSFGITYHQKILSVSSVLLVTDD